jgi:protein disulfide-isomerase A6
MKPAYENVARAFATESDCVVAHMDADDGDNKPVASKYDVRSFPTIKFFPKGSKSPIPYESGRSEAQFIEVSPDTYPSCGSGRQWLIIVAVPEPALRYSPIGRRSLD